MPERLFDEAFLRQLERLAVIFRSAANSQVQGERRSMRRGQSVEFADFRPYTLGDDFRRVDWNAYARLERLFLKLFNEEEEIVLYLLIDNSRSMDWGDPNKLWYALRAAAAIGYITLAGLDRVFASALFAKDRSINNLPLMRGKTSAVRLFDSLKAISAGPEHDSLENKFASLSASITHPSAMIILSDLMQDAWQPAINHLSGRGHEISILHVLSPDEISPQMSGEYRLVDSETRSEIEITADYETMQIYQHHRTAWQDSWQKYCATRRMAYVPLSTDLPLEDLIFASLPRYGVLR